MLITFRAQIIVTNRSTFFVLKKSNPKHSFILIFDFNPRSKQTIFTSQDIHVYDLKAIGGKAQPTETCSIAYRTLFVKHVHILQLNSCPSAKRHHKSSQWRKKKLLTLI